MLLTPSLKVFFDRPLRAWDGFGFNYVEACQTRDYAANPQDYGGFSLLTAGEREEILNLVFGPDGLRPGLIKMFLDPFHQPEPGPDYNFDPNKIDLTAYDHATTTRWMRMAAREGQARTRAQGGDLQIIVAMYGPPAWMTAQKIVRGRDLDPKLHSEVAKYMISWAKFLREVEGLNVKYISLHNEGEDWERWPVDGSGPGDENHDYNLYWSPEQVAEFIKRMPPVLAAQGMADVGVTPGECTNWYRFDAWGYAGAVAHDPEALRNLGLITSHGFYAAGSTRWYGDWRSTGIDLLRAERPELHAWVTSTSWSKMDVDFLNEIRNNIYAAKVNGIIPWAGVQLEGRWVGGDPNPGCAFKVQQGGGYRVERGYYYFKQVCRAGQPGMNVVETVSNDTQVGLIGFGAGETRNPHAFILLNQRDQPMELEVEINGGPVRAFDAYCTTDADLRYAPQGRITVTGNKLAYTAPPRSATTFYAVE
jgi:O-glycosyl hydrolase